MAARESPRLNAAFPRSLARFACATLAASAALRRAASAWNDSTKLALEASKATSACASRARRCTASSSIVTGSCGTQLSHFL